MTTRSYAPFDSGSVTGKMIDGNALVTDELISDLLDHVQQGRIFDARSIVTKLQAIEKIGFKGSALLDSVRPVMEEVVIQSNHVESLLHELHSEENWTLAKHKSGVTVHYRRESNSLIHTIRAATVFDNFSPRDFVRFCSLFVETELMHLWFPGNFLQPANVLSWHSKYSKVIHLRINLGIPMMSCRDAIVLGNGYHLPDRNAFLICTKTIIGDSCRYCGIPPPDKGVVRILTESIFFVQLVNRNTIVFKMIGRDDLKLKFMPTTILNYVSQGHLPFEIIKTIHRTVRNFEGTLWEKKIKERGAYYSEIERKVHDQLLNWEKDGHEGIISKEVFDDHKRNKNEPAKLVTPKPRGKYYTGSQIINLLCVWGEKLFVASMMLAIISVLIDVSPGIKLFMNMHRNKHWLWSTILAFLGITPIIIIYLTSKKNQDFQDDTIEEKTKENIQQDKVLPKIEHREMSRLTPSPQSPSSDALHEREMCAHPLSIAPAPQLKSRSKYEFGMKSFKKAFQWRGKRKKKK